MTRRERVLSWSTVLLWCLIGLIWPDSAAGARPSVTSISFLGSGEAGTTVTLRVQAAAFQPSVGICFGRALLQSPSGKQTREISLVGSHSGTLEGSFAVPAGAESGRWHLLWLEVTDNDLVSSRLEAGVGFDHGLVLRGAQPDFSPPRVTRLSWSGRSSMQGEPVRLTVSLDAPASEVAFLTAEVAPVMEQGEPLWTRSLRLTPVDDTSRTWEATFLAPVMAVPTSQVQVTAVEVSDLAGNRLRLDSAGLKDKGAAVLSVVPKPVPPELETDPFLVNVVHVGYLSFLEWNRQDLILLGKIWDQMSRDPDRTTAELTYQILELEQAVQGLRQEVYTDPENGFRYVPLNTAGKWRAVDKALRARVLMLVELDRRVGANQAARLEKEDLLGSTVITYEPGGDLEAVEPALYLEGGAALMSAVMETVRRGGLPAGLMKAAHQAPTSDSLHYIDEGLIWFQPFTRPGVLASHHSDRREIALYLNRIATPQQFIHSLFHELGHHFSEAFVGSLSGGIGPHWQEYLSLRGGHPWLPNAGWAGRPWENLAEDFAYLMLPDDLRPQYETEQQYRPLSDSPEMVEQFRDWAATLAGEIPELPPTIPFFSPAYGGTILSPAVTWNPELQGKCAFLSHLQDNVPTILAVRSHAVSDKEGVRVLCAGGKALGRIGFLRLELGRSGQAQTHTRLVTLLASPAQLTFGLPPRATKDPETLLLGSLWNGEIFVNGRPGKIAGGKVIEFDRNGVHHLWHTSADRPVLFDSLDLQEGENSFEISARDGGGRTLSLRGHVFREAEGIEIPLKLEFPSEVTADRVLLMGSTRPNNLVSVGKYRAASGPSSEFALWVYGLASGSQRLEVTVTSAGGHAVTKSIHVRYGNGGRLTVEAPRKTNGIRTEIRGRAVSARRVLVQGSEVPVDADGRFTAWVKLRSGTTAVEIQAEDRDGRVHRSVREIEMVPDLLSHQTRGASATWTGQVEPGSTASLEGAEVPIGRDGAYRIPLTLKRAGSHRFLLQVRPPSGEPYSIEANVLRSLFVDLPTHTNRSSISASGQTLPGAKVRVDGAAVSVDSSGRFGLEVDLRGGSDSLSIAVIDLAVPWAGWESPGDEGEFCGGATMDGKPLPVAACKDGIYLFPGAAASLPFGKPVYDWSELPPNARLIDGPAWPVRVVALRGELITQTVRRFDPQGRAVDGKWEIPLPAAARGTRFVAPAWGLSAEEGSEPARIALPYRPGRHTVRVEFIRPDGAEGYMLFDVSIPARNSPVLELQVGSRSAEVNGEPAILTAAPRIHGGTLYVPARFLAEALGGSLVYDPDLQRLNITKGDRRLIMDVGSTDARIDGSPATLTAPPELLDGYVMLPLRVVVEILGYRLVWDAETQTATIWPLP